VGAPFAEVVAGLRERLPLLREVVVVGEEYEAWLAAASPVDLPPPDPDGQVLQLYKSGTTGFPKGVMLPTARSPRTTPPRCRSCRRSRTRS